MGRPYKLVMRVEEGALAELFKATAAGPGAPEVFVKLFAPKASDPLYGKALAEAAARARALNHPQILTYDEIGSIGDRMAAVRPWVDGYNLGEALRRLMSKEVVLTTALAIYIVAEAAQVISAAHAQGWIHGAITPGNIILGRDGKVRVTDFGALDAMNASPALKLLAAKGRHAYRAPEMKNPGAGAPGADVYSLGAIAYELVTLREVAAVRGGGLSTKRDGLQAPSRVDRRLNARLDPPIMRALETAATRRHKGGAEMAESLRGLFTVLGYAPSHAELIKFVKDLFPQEVSMGGVGGPPPFTDFTLTEIRADGKYQQAAAPAEAVADLFGSGAVSDPRRPFTSTELPRFGASDEGSQETADDADPVAPEPPAAPPATKSFDDWDAPPGAMPASTKLARGKAPEPEPTVPLPQQPTMEVSSLPAPSEKSSSKKRPARRNDTQPIPDMAFDPAGDLNKGKHQSTEADWHVPPPVPVAPKAKPKVPLQAWLMAVAVCVSIALFSYVAIGRKLGVSSLDALKSSHQGPPPQPQSGLGTPPPMPEPTRKPMVAAGAASLSIDTDLPARVFIDGTDIGESTPLSSYTVSPGKHLVKLVATGMVPRDFSVTLRAGDHEKRVETFRVTRRAAPPKPVVASKKGLKH